jgi:hypothetical protein
MTSVSYSKVMQRTLLISDGVHLCTRRVRLRDRLSALWHALELDRALADGAPPESSPALAIRARDLSGYVERRRLAHQILRIARESNGSRGVRVSVVSDAADDLERLAQRLLDPGPVAARGVARARLLLTDGAGALYWRRAAVDLRAAVEEALEGLELPE